MTAHISEELPRLLTGEATRDVVQAAAAHLRSCADCQQELVSAVVAHASLSSAHRFAAEVVARPVDLTVPAAEAATPLPNLSAVFAQVRQEAKSQPAPRRSRRTAYAAAAVAAGVLIGGGGTVLVQNLSDTSTKPSGTSVALSAFGQGNSHGQAVVSGDQMKLDAAALPRLDAKHRYEVWLTNDQRTQMQPLGWIGPKGTATLTVPPDLMATYSDIEVSIQRVDAPTYTYSGTSVLRGSYA